MALSTLNTGGPQKMDAAEKARLAKRDDGTVARPEQNLKGNAALRGRVAGSGLSDETKGHINRRTRGK